MKQGKHAQGNTPLPLPTPRSDPALDRKIIHYARANAPPREPYRSPRWYAGMATAAVVVAAVLLTLPPQAPAPATPQTRQQPAPGAVPPPPAAAEMSRLDKQKPQAETASEARAVSRLADEADADVAADIDVEATAPKTVRQSAEAFAGKAAAPRIPLGREELVQQLERCRTLLQSGNEVQARAEYRQLRLDCPACDLPEQLENALSLYPARE